MNKTNVPSAQIASVSHTAKKNIRANASVPGLSETKTER